MRIASLLPAATDTVVALGLAERLVAVTFECSVTGCPVDVDTVLPPDLAPEDLPLDVARIGRLNAVRIDGASGVGYVPVHGYHEPRGAGGTFEFTVYHEGAVTVVGSSITFALSDRQRSGPPRSPLPRRGLHQPGSRPETTGSGCSVTNKACTPTG